MSRLAYPFIVIQLSVGKKGIWYDNLRGSCTERHSTKNGNPEGDCNIAAKKMMMVVIVKMIVCFLEGSQWGLPTGRDLLTGPPAAERP